MRVKAVIETARRYLLQTLNRRQDEGQFGKEQRFSSKDGQKLKAHWNYYQTDGYHGENQEGNHHVVLSAAP